MVHPATKVRGDGEGGRVVEGGRGEGGRAVEGGNDESGRGDGGRDGRCMDAWRSGSHPMRMGRL